jgi:hypothetical protein
MYTDIPLKRLTALRAADLLPLIGAPGATLVAVETLEMPASARRLDSALRLRSPGGQEYLHVIEWQGYHDAAVLWRLTGYLAWLGQREPGLAVIGTVIYLLPAADIGGEVSPPIDGAPSLGLEIPYVRLWELEAEAALTSGSLGLAVLSPLMHGASSTLVAQAATAVMAQAPPQQQADLLSILGAFAEPLITRDAFVRMVGKEKLMASDLLSYLMEEKLAEIEQQHAAELAQQRAELLQTLQEATEDVVVARFPSMPVGLVQNVRTVTNLEQLKELRSAVLATSDQAAVERLLAALAPAN